MATASCAVTAALSGADDRCDAAVDIMSWGNLNHPAPHAGGEHLAD